MEGPAMAGLAATWVALGGVVFVCAVRARRSPSALRRGRLALGVLFIGLLVVFEAAAGVLVLAGGRRTQVGMLAMIGSHAALLSFGSRVLANPTLR